MKSGKTPTAMATPTRIFILLACARMVAAELSSEILSQVRAIQECYTERQGALIALQERVENNQCRNGPKSDTDDWGCYQTLQALLTSAYSSIRPTTNIGEVGVLVEIYVACENNARQDNLRLPRMPCLELLLYMKSKLKKELKSYRQYGRKS